LSAARLFAWALGSFQIRFQMPVYPILSVGAAYVALQIAPSLRSRLPWRDFAPLLAVAFCAATLAYQGIHLSLNRPLPVALGLESRRAYLTRIIKDFPAWRHAEEEALPSRSVLLLGDGRGYYCPRACVPDPDHFRWASEIAGLPDDGALTEWLEARRLEYVLLSTESLDFLLQHDPTGVLMAAVERVFRWREAGCLRPVYDNGWAALYAVACRGGTP
jgi:hypothetical protein